MSVGNNQTAGQARPFDERERERFRKIVGVMEGATIEGERQAAHEAAERMAAMHGMSLDDAILEAHPERDDGHISAEEAQARRNAYRAWSADRMRWSDAKEAAEKRRHEEARAEARRRGMQDEEPNARRPTGPRYTPHYKPSHYRPTAADRFRLIAGLLRDGVPLRRVANIADATTNEVARVWLLIRQAGNAEPG